MQIMTLNWDWLERKLYQSKGYTHPIGFVELWANHIVQVCDLVVFSNESS